MMTWSQFWKYELVFIAGMLAGGLCGAVGAWFGVKKVLLREWRNRPWG